MQVLGCLVFMSAPSLRAIDSNFGILVEPIPGQRPTYFWPRPVASWGLFITPGGLVMPVPLDVNVIMKAVFRPAVRVAVLMRQRENCAHRWNCLFLKPVFGSSSKPALSAHLHLPIAAIRIPAYGRFVATLAKTSCVGPESDRRWNCRWIDLLFWMIDYLLRYD